MSRPPPDPIFVFQEFRNASISAVNFAQCQCIESGKVFLLTGTSDGILSFWDLEIKKKLQTKKFPNNQGILSCGDLNGQKLWVHLRDSGLVFLNPKTLEILDEIKSGHYGFCACENFDKYFALPNVEKDLPTIEIWEVSNDSKTKKNTLSIEKKFGLPMEVQFLNRGNLELLVAFEDGSIGLFDTFSGAGISNFKPHKDTAMTISYHSNLNIGFSGSTDNFIQIWTLDQGGKFDWSREERIVLKSCGISRLRIRPDGKILAAACWDGILRIYSVKSRGLLAVLDYHQEGSLKSLVFPPAKVKDQWLLAAGSDRSEASLWNVYG